MVSRMSGDILWNFCALPIIIYSYLLRSTAAVPIDNAVLGPPDIVCQPDSMSLAVETKKSFTGHLYVKGQFKNPLCHLDSTASRDEATLVKYTVKFADCSIMRIRAFAGNGVMFIGTVILQFHPLFVTKADRGFSFTCAYTPETSKTLEQGIDVSPQNFDYEFSMIPTTEIMAAMTMPSCTYTIHKGTVDGPPVRFATVGETVYHKWQCTGTTHGIFVHTCNAIDESGIPSSIIDMRGCSVDPVAMADLEYSPELNMATAEVHVFKFADQSHVTIRCQLTVCMKMDDGCAGITPPTCGTGRRTTLAPGVVGTTQIIVDMTPTPSIGGYSTVVIPTPPEPITSFTFPATTPGAPPSVAPPTGSPTDYRFSNGRFFDDGPYGAQRYGRNVDVRTMDISSPEVLVLANNEVQPNEVCRSLLYNEHVQAERTAKNCLSTLMFVYIICTLGALFSATLIISMWCVRRYYKQYYEEKMSGRRRYNR